MVHSLAAGRPIAGPAADTIADGIAVRVPVPEAVADLAGLVDETRLVDDADIVQAMRLLHRHAGAVVEPAGAVGVAALLSGVEAWVGARVATVLCGSNVAPEQARAWLGC
jgi:threonine dehydratase